MNTKEELEYQANYWANEAEETLAALASDETQITYQYAETASLLALFYQIKYYLTRQNAI